MHHRDIDPPIAAPARYTSPSWALVLILALSVWLLVGCGTTVAQKALAAEPKPHPSSPAVVVAVPVDEARKPHLAEPLPPLPAPDPVPKVLAHSDALLRMGPAELTREIARLGELEEAAAENPLLLALALMQTRQAVDTARALGLVQRVLASPSPPSQALHPLARLLEARLLQQRRLEDQQERQSQQLRDAQRRNEQLNERLEAVRAIERSLTTRPPVPAPPANAPGSTVPRAAP